MVRRFLLATSLCIALLLVSATGVVRAQDDDRVLADPGIETGPYSFKLYQDEVDAYHTSIEDCSTPSLECLVRNTTRFVAIEWVFDIIGPKNTIVSSPGGGDGSLLNTTSPVASRSRGAIAGLYGMIGSMYAYPPANTYRYVADVLDDAGIASPAYAQGLGFASLDPILSLWKSFRNVAYFFFIAIMIVVGIIIMLRQKVSAQASVSAQQALPSIIVSLILVTFSYAIAGLLIDVMYLSMFLIAGMFDVISEGTVSANLGTSMVNMNIFELAGNMFTGGGASWAALNANSNIVTQVITSVGGSEASSGTGEFFGFLGGLTLSIVIAIAVLIGTVKLFFELLKSYASIIMGVVFAPLYLMMGAIPGKNAVGPWIKNLIGNLAAFPTVLLFVIIFQVFTSRISGNDGQGGFMPPYLIGNGQSGIAGYIIGLAILLALPEIVKEVKKKLGASEGGFGMLVAGAAAARGKEAWNKGVLGVSGKGVMTGATMVASGGVGALVGGGINKLRGGSFREGAKTGAMYGAATPVGLRIAPGLIKDAYGIVKSEASEMVAEEIMGRAAEKAARTRGARSQLGQRLYAAWLRRSNVRRKQRQNLGDDGPGENTGAGNA